MDANSFTVDWHQDSVKWPISMEVSSLLRKLEKSLLVGIGGNFCDSHHGMFTKGKVSCQRRYEQNTCVLTGWSCSGKWWAHPLVGVVEQIALSTSCTRWPESQHRGAIEGFGPEEHHAGRLVIQQCDGWSELFWSEGQDFQEYPKLYSEHGCSLVRG